MASASAAKREQEPQRPGEAVEVVQPVQAKGIRMVLSREKGKFHFVLDYFVSFSSLNQYGYGVINQYGGGTNYFHGLNIHVFLHLSVVLHTVFDCLTNVFIFFKLF